MKKRVGQGYPVFKCEINKFRDDVNCKRDSSICTQKNWLAFRHQACIVNEMTLLRGKDYQAPPIKTIEVHKQEAESLVAPEVPIKKIEPPKPDHSRF